MNEEVTFVLDTTKESMDSAMAHLEKAFIKIRAGKASPMMLSTVKVEYYGSPTPLSQVANINTPDARTISVQPWEKSILHDIESRYCRDVEPPANPLDLPLYLQDC